MERIINILTIILIFIAYAVDIKTNKMLHLEVDDLTAKYSEKVAEYEKKSQEYEALEQKYNNLIEKVKEQDKEEINEKIQ